MLTSRRPFFRVAYPEETLRPRVVIVLRVHLLHQMALLGMLGCILLQQKQFNRMIHGIHDSLSFRSLRNRCFIN